MKEVRIFALFVIFKMPKLINEKKRKFGQKWSQEETEKLAALIIKYGMAGILNNCTNCATVEKKNAEWADFHREEAALRLRYRQVLMQMRSFAKYERENRIATGGDPPQLKPKEVKIDVTGPLLDLFQLYGELMSGLESRDSDKPVDEPVPEQSVLVGLFEEETQSSQPSTSSAKVQVQNSDINLQNQAQVQVRRTAYRYGSNQFFATKNQRRRTAKIPIERNFETERIEMLADIRSRAAEMHELRKAESAARITALEAQTKFWTQVSASSSVAVTVIKNTNSSDDEGIVEYLEEEA